MVTVAPGFAMRGEGREACVQSYRDFMSAAKVIRYRESAPVIDVFGDTGVSTFRWEMTWEMQGQTHDESGHDLFVFARQDGRWLAAWRTLLVQPPTK